MCKKLSIRGLFLSSHGMFTERDQRNQSNHRRLKGIQNYNDKYFTLTTTTVFIEMLWGSVLLQMRYLECILITVGPKGYCKIIVLGGN